MKKQLICIVMLFMCTMVFAQSKNWSDETRDAAYEAPNSMLQKKWFEWDFEQGSEHVHQFLKNGTFTLTVNVSKDDVRYIILNSGKYTRNKDKLTIRYLTISVTPNKSDLAKLPARKRDSAMSIAKELKSLITADYANKVENYLILRLDDEYFVYTTYDTKTKMFNDINWTTLYSELHKKKQDDTKSDVQFSLPLEKNDIHKYHKK